MISAIILAGGKGSRMRSSLPKALHQLAHQTLIESILKNLQLLLPQQLIVVGSRALFEHEIWKNIYFNFQQKNCFIKEVLQENPLGTGHAVQMAFPSLQTDKIIICHADTPLIQPQTFQRLYESSFDLTLSAMILENPQQSSCGRLILKGSQPVNIVEAKEATQEQKKIKLANAAVYAISRECLKACLFDLNNKNATGEFYFTDIVQKAFEKGFSTSYLEISSDEAFGVDTPENLIEAPVQKVLRKKMIQNGVLFQDPSSIVLSMDTQIGLGSVIEAYNVFGPCVTIGKNTTIHPFCVLDHCFIGDYCSVGPFSHIKMDSVVHSKAVIGNFVEIKKSNIGYHTKVKHLAYIGDATLGKSVNIGAGSIFCNYDGFQKHPTIVGDHVHVGANSSLIAPLKIGQSSFIGAGSVITKDVPEEALAISRSPQIHNFEWIVKKNKQQK